MAGYTDIEVGQKAPFNSELLLIHARESRDVGRPLAIMIHGLQGDGFQTWKAILQSEWMRTAAPFDVGLVNYSSGFKRYSRLNHISPSQIAADLATELSQLSPRKIVLIGHSMGGLIAKDTLQQLHNRFGPLSVHTRSVAGIITLCTPSTGSGWAKVLRLVPGPAWRDRQALSRHSDMQRQIELFFSTWVDMDLRGVKSYRIHVPTYGASASQDLIVNAMGAELGLPASQRGRLAGGHSSALRAPSTVSWLQSVMSKILDNRDLAPKRQVIRAEFNGSATFPAWEAAYRLAISQFAEEHGQGSVEDLISACARDRELPDLIVRAYRADGPQAGVPSDVHSDVRRQQSSGGRTALGISPIGPAAAAALQQLQSQADAPRLRWFRAAGDNDAEIVAAFREFLELTAGVFANRSAHIQQRVPLPWGGSSDGI